MYDFRRITLFCSEKRFSKHRMTIFSKNLGVGCRVGSIISNLFIYNYNYSFKFFNYITITITLCYKSQIIITIILKLVINYKSKLQTHFERICWMVPKVVPGQISL